MRCCFIVLLLAVQACSCRQDNPGVDAQITLLDAATNTEVTCENLEPVSSGTCSVTSGTAGTLIKGEVLTPNTLFHGGQVAIDGEGIITCVGCDCAKGDETVIICPDAAISPGLINTHDHITFAQNDPYTDAGIRYEHRHQWRKGQDSRPKIPSSGGASADQIRWGELRFLMGGATSIVGSGGQAGLVRNLDSSQQEGLNQKPVNFDTFPLDDSGGNRREADCNYGGDPATPESIASDDAYEPHTAEGIDATARNEFLCQSSTDYDSQTPGVSNNILLAKTAMIHSIGLQPADYAAMASAGTGLIWSPRSNITLYGDTARVSTAAQLGVEIALGTDWMPTGSMNLLRELACADNFNKTYLGGFFNDIQLWQMVTVNAAAVTATDDVIGVLAPGKVADISIFNRHGKPGYRAVIEAKSEDVVLVMRTGKALYGDAELVDALRSDSCDELDVCGSPKRLCVMTEVGKSYTSLKDAVGANMYPAFACGVPDNEPSCTPMRPEAVEGSSIYTGESTATDADGDGIPDSSDNCPNVFNPVRPVDDGAQGDSDDDGAGDACDVCPLDANTATCTKVDPEDRDSDGVLNPVDNCPDKPNPDQLDADGDGKGDLCDVCPAEANPGSAGCPTTIYKIKNGTTPVGTIVRVLDALVTGKGSNGFFVQTKMGDQGYAGAELSGLFIYTGTSSPLLANAVVGTRVVIDGTIVNFQGQLELDNVSAVSVANASPEALPAPVATTYAEIKTGGPKAAAYESVIVSLGPASISAVNPMYGEVTLTDAGGNQLVVDDFLYTPVPAPAIGQSYSAVKGILTLRQMASKLEPRGAADLTPGAPGLASFGPAISYARVGTTSNDPTFPGALTVTLSGPAQGDTVVTITSETDSALTVSNVTVPDGATSAQVRVSAVAADPDVVVTASLGMQSMTASVRVLGASEAPTSVTLSPSDGTVSPNGTTMFTVTLDAPALTATAVDLAVNPSNAGTLPAQVTVPANQTSTTFTYTDASEMGTATLTATFGASTSHASVTVSTGANHLVINEVDYDQIGSDNAEFIEIYNPSGSAISLAGKQLLLINGSGSVIYDTITLGTGSIPSHGYLVIAGANVTVMSPAVKLDPGWTSDRIQNGAPDGIALIDTTTHTLIDAISYEGAMTMVDLPGFPAPSSLVEGTVLPTTIADSNTTNGSLCRSPTSQDTDDAAADWVICATSTAGKPNM
ncbi:MAG: thrombospondin type 3 repeat-containing protein [Kofleriaceae bacterium]